MTHYCYVLESEEDKKYIGSTDDIQRRMKEHNSPNGNSKRFTKKSNNWKVIHLETFETKEEAHVREKQIKSWKGGRALRLLLNR